MSSALTALDWISGEIWVQLSHSIGRMYLNILAHVTFERGYNWTHAYTQAFIEMIRWPSLLTSDEVCTKLYAVQYVMLLCVLLSGGVHLLFWAWCTHTSRWRLLVEIHRSPGGCTSQSTREHGSSRDHKESYSIPNTTYKGPKLVQNWANCQWNHVICTSQHFELVHCVWLI